MVARRGKFESNIIHTIRGLVKGYDRGSIIKEYLQNSGDSGATDLTITFDKRVHQRLEGTVFEPVMGPSLLITNNSSFSPHDFDSIISPLSMGKAKDHNSVGQFGQGFSCSFSVSDHPSFISSGQARWIDVHEVGIGKEIGANLGEWDIPDPEIEDWLETFKLPKQDIDDGTTTFRLPLRDTFFATESQISSDVFTFEDFTEWIKEWRCNASNLLFIKNISNLSLQEVTETGDVICHVKIETINSEQVRDVHNRIDVNHNGCDTKEILHNCILDNKELLAHFYKHQLLISSLDIITGEITEEVEVWGVVNGLFNGRNNSLIKQALKIREAGAQSQTLLPSAGAAILLKSDNDVLRAAPRKIFTFLPLTALSSYPVHLHGWFNVDTKRTDIERNTRAGNTQQTLMEWNRLLMRDAVSVAWAKLINCVKNELSLNTYFSLWPVRDENDSFNNYIL
jgi:hypothetical protein